MKIVIISGYFDPITVGHIEYIKLSKKIAGSEGKLVAIVNNNEQAILKKGRPFMKCVDRMTILNEIKDVDYVFESTDTNRTVIDSIKEVYNIFKNEQTDFYFCNGGDAFNDNIPESEICKELNIQLVDSLGEKISSSSWLTGLKPL